MLVLAFCFLSTADASQLFESQEFDYLSTADASVSCFFPEYS